MAQTTSKKQTKKKSRKKRQSSKNSGTRILLLALIVLLAVFLLLFRAAFRLGDSHRQEDVPAPETSETAPSPSEYLPASSLVPEGFGWENGYKTYAYGGQTAYLGIDVSAFQGWIDWQQVADSGVDFAIIRAGYRGYGDGSTHQDEYLTYNIESAQAAGLDVGVYFFSQALDEIEARAEAYAVLAMVRDYDLQLPVYFDWEPIADDSARTSTISSSELTAGAKAFCQIIEQEGYEAGVYFNLSMATHYYHLNELSDYDFWLAEYQETPSYPFAIDAWQYSSEGSVPGIDTQVDMNLMFR